MCQNLSMQYMDVSVRRESFSAPLWSPRKVSLPPFLSPEQQKSNENHLVINGSLEGPMNG